ncbi:phosphatase PAP2 family protein [Pandoraea sp. ISTKB]|uniref:phosphatase PAP2 family protein n=1 Tax=Pandoraea sp. ISTKB TaxID=1586708 RepID=UPI000846B909|nr:phosphatase PAP2 family protein [Pandoraea sp. ISTKB]ODP34177.1 hypothetical protein A9762_03710 [Pandoraea sp. ISTKB]
MSPNLWRLYWATWLANISLIVVDVTWGGRAGLSVLRSDIEWMIVRCGLGVLLASVLMRAAVSRRLLATTRGDAYGEAGVGVLWVTTLACFSGAAMFFQYLSVSVSAPDIANWLVSADARLGIDWPSLYHAMRARPWLDVTLSLAYQSVFPQLALLPLVLIYTRNIASYAEFVVQFMVASAVVMLIATLFPAESAFVHFHIQDPNTVSTVSDFMDFRTGKMRELSIWTAQGLISFPSFHAVLGVLFTYATRKVERLFPFVFGWNALMIVSTPTHGGHYVWDVIMGLVVGAIAIAIGRVLAGVRRDASAQAPVIDYRGT